MSIPANFLDELIARSDIVDVISDYVHLTKKAHAQTFISASRNW